MALRYYEEAKNKDGAALYHLCRFYSCGLGVERDPIKAAHYFQLLADKETKDRFDNYYIGKCYWKGFGVKRDCESAKSYFFNAAKDAMHAPLLIGEYYETVAHDIAQATAYYKLAADDGQHQAQFRLCKAYQLGLGVTLNVDKAKQYFQALEKNEKPFRVGERCGNISLCYKNGYGVSADPNRAKMLYMQAANDGYAEAQFHCCKMDAQHASLYFRWLSDPNHPEQDHEIEKRYRWIGIAYREGFGVDKNEREAQRYLQLAKDLGDEDASALLNNSSVVRD
jgi:TPR repeat protein